MTGPAALDMAYAAEVLSRISEREVWQARERAAWHAGMRCGWRDGYRAGRTAEGAERDAAWNAIAAPVARPGPSHAVLEERRWGPRGREHFADPKPGDFPGRARTPARRGGG